MTTFAKKHRRYTSKAKSAAPSAASEALVETMCLAACVDGRLEDGEAVALAGQIMATPGFSHLGAEQVAAMVKQMVSRLAKEGIAKRVKSISTALAGDRQAREEAFALATLFALFDGEVRDEEQALLDSLQKALGISDDCAARVSALLSEG
jgi:tellurite resistance protein